MPQGNLQLTAVSTPELLSPSVGTIALVGEDLPDATKSALVPRAKLLEPL